MARNKREIGKIQQSLGTAKRYQERISARLTATTYDWQKRVEAGMQNMDIVFPRAFAQQQLAPQLALVNRTAAQLSPEDLKAVANFMSDMDSDSGSNPGAGTGAGGNQSGKERKRKPELSPAQLKLVMLLMVLMLLFLAACSNTVGTTGPTREAEVEPTQIVQVEEDEPIVPTQTAESPPSPAPLPPTVEPIVPEETEEEIPAEEVPEETEEAETEESPQLDLTRIPQEEIIQAAEEVGVTLTPEAVAQFQSTRESGQARKIMFRLAGSGENATVEVARSDANGNVTYEVIPTPGATGVSEDPENDGVLLVMADTDLAFSVDTNAQGESEVTVVETPEPDPAQEVENPSQSVELAQAVVGPEIQVVSVGIIQAETVVPKGETGETVSYQVAYNEHGIPVARYSNENSGDYEWIAGGPFAKSELNDGLSHFPGVKNGLNYLSINVRVSVRLDYNGSSGNEPFVLLDASGNPTNFVCESAVVGHYLNANGEEETGIFPIIISNAQTGQRIQMQSFSEVPLPEWQFQDHLDQASYIYFLQNSATAGEFYDDPQEVNYWLDDAPVKPLLGFGDSISFPFNFPGANPSGNSRIINGAEFIDPLASSFYNSPNYAAFVASGDLDNFGPSQELLGLPVIPPRTVINWNEDLYR